MESLFAPWRMEWVTRDRSDDDWGDCLFCDIPDRAGDRENLVLARTDSAYVLLNNRPYNPGHVLVVPSQHEGQFHRLERPTLVDVLVLAQTVMEAIDRGMAPEGFNLGLNVGAAGGASVPDHLHLHVIPRWKSDTTFMPLTADTAVVEQAIQETYDQLRTELLDIAGTTVEREADAVRVAPGRDRPPEEESPP